MSDELTEIRSRLDEHEERIGYLEHEVSTRVVLDKAVSFSEFVNIECQPQFHKEKVATIGYFLEAYEEVESFSKQDLEEGYERAGLSKPSNISDMAGEAVSEGWLEIVKADQPREWALTKTGAKMVESLPGDTDG